MKAVFIDFVHRSKVCDQIYVSRLFENSFLINYFLHFTQLGSTLSKLIFMMKIIIEWSISAATFVSRFFLFSSFYNTLEVEALKQIDVK